MRKCALPLLLLVSACQSAPPLQSNPFESQEKSGDRQISTLQTPTDLGNEILVRRMQIQARLSTANESYDQLFQTSKDLDDALNTRLRFNHGQEDQNRYNVLRNFSLQNQYFKKEIEALKT